MQSTSIHGNKFSSGPGTLYDNNEAARPHLKKVYISTTVDDLRQVFADSPELGKGALKGMSFVAGQNQNLSSGNYLFSLDAKDSIIVTLYNPLSGKGVVHHFDEKRNIEKEVRKAIRFLGGMKQSEKIEAHLIGGIWFGAGEQLGDHIKNTLRTYQIEPAWKEWSFTPCWGHTYGAVLNLKHGNLSVFEHTAEVGAAFQKDKWHAAQHQISSLPVEPHASDFSLADFNSFDGNSRDIKSFQNSVGSVDYQLIGETRYIHNFRNLFNERIDHIRGELAKKTYPEIKAFLEGIKQALPGQENIDLVIKKPLRRASSSISSSQDESGSFSRHSFGRSSRRASSGFSSSHDESGIFPRNLTNRRSLRRSSSSLSSSQDESIVLSRQSSVDALEIEFTDAYVLQEQAFSDEQRELAHRTAAQIVDDKKSGIGSKAHPAPVPLFSSSDQKKISDIYGPATTRLFSYTLAGWEGGNKGRGKWRLIYYRQGEKIRFFGVYDTHHRPYSAFT